MINRTKIEKIQFGSTPFEMDDLANKVLTGEKIATSSLLDYYLIGLKTQSKVGDYFSVLNSSGEEVAIIRIEKIATIKLGDITESFAVDEGDGNLENWLTIHQPYYSKLLFAIRKELDKDTLLLCEWFRELHLL